MVSQICRVAPRIKIHHSDPSMDRMIRNVRQLKQVFEPYRMMFKQLRGKTRSSHHNVSAKKRKTLKKIKYCFGGGQSIIHKCLLFAGVLQPNPREKQGMSVQYLSACYVQTFLDSIPHPRQGHRRYF
jgi:hypothetical protein